MSFLRYRKIFYIFSGTLALAGIASLAAFGLPLSQEFTGGSLLDVVFDGERPSAERVSEALKSMDLGTLSVGPQASQSLVIRFRPVDEATHQKVLQALRTLASGDIRERRFDTIGPTLGKELRQKSIAAVVLSLAGIFIYLLIVFRQSRGRISSFRYAWVGVATLFHDVVITVGLMAIAARWGALELNPSFLAALLTITGYSINDTIVVYDRIRETISTAGERDLGRVVDAAIVTTLRRSVFTSLTTLLSLVAIFLFGGTTLTAFALTLIIGIVIGTYSSICIASPLLVPIFRTKTSR